MKRSRTCFLLFLLMLGMGFAQAKGPTGLYLTGDRSGFFMNPIMDRVYVQKVDPNSEADRAGFRQKDVVLEIEGRKIPGTRARELLRYWDSIKAHARIKFLIQRGDTVMAIFL